MDDAIRIRGARQHNLKSVDVDIPRNRLTAVSGLSGSGKSSLVFDTLYAEGQRSYVESLSTYARQFLDRMPKPDLDWVDGIGPSIAIEQRNAARSGRSTVGTVTEINDYLRVLFSRVGRTVCPACNERVEPETPASVWKAVRSAWGEDDAVLICHPLDLPPEGAAPGWADSLLAQGFQRAVVDGEVLRLDDAEPPAPAAGAAVDVVVDRLRLQAKARARFAEAVELAFQQSGGRVVLRREADRLAFSNRRACNGCGRVFPEPTPHLFSFNSPHGACPDCNGFGNRLEFDEEKIVPDDGLSLLEGAIKPWRTDTFAHAATSMARFCKAKGIPMDRSWRKLTDAQRRQVLESREGKYVGPIPFLEDMRAEMKKAHHRFFTRRFMGDTTCRTCGGSRLRTEALAVKVGTLDLGQISRLSVRDGLSRMDGLRLSQADRAAAGDVLEDVLHRLTFLEKVGLGYLTLDRLTRTLSGGEAQRIHLANALGSRLVDTLYVLDEPTSGLHPDDVQRLIGTLQDLVELGNTVVVVEHDLEVLAHAHHMVELGPAAGTHGGEVVYQGPVAGLRGDVDTLTADYLTGRRRLPERAPRKAKADHVLTVKGARRHNLRNLDVSIPLERLVCLTGLSGSGKSTLMNDCLHDGLTGREAGGPERGKPFTGFQGAGWVDKVVRVDQTPIGKSSRSNPATYLGVLGPIRELFAATPEARARGYDAGRFSFNTAGGRCPECQGLGEHRVEMHFMADISVPCDVCGATRFNPATLEVRLRGRTIAQVLDLTIEEALAFFRDANAVRDRLWILRKVGLGYLTLGQSATTLSGGESQRLKIARELASPGGKRNLYLLDEPTTGLHVHDVAQLVGVLNELVDAGHSVVVIEHNLDLIARADWVVDLGPGGGDAGGRLVAQGTPRQVAEGAAGPTGRHLAAYFRAERNAT
ncbi:MAG TPA: excinuclease ABC subunit UvrA [Candidatus Krumholzibacteria bacterium]|nr:excinuclease ABC subunit UvrA [Candidatus Krumholzibacteria bacterium]HRX50220.1 excinuclease ABC subunit UvrA [Candidatus Krumholzibacteria bacterium]